MDDIETLQHDMRIKLAAADRLIALAQQAEQTARGEASISRAQLRGATAKFEAEASDLRRKVLDLQRENDALKERITSQIRADAWRAKTEQAVQRRAGTTA